VGDAEKACSINQDDKSFVERFPAQSLTAAVAVGLIFPVQRHSALGTNGEGNVVTVQMDFLDGHGAAKRLGGTLFAIFGKCAFLHKAPTTAAMEFRSSASNTTQPRL